MFMINDLDTLIANLSSDTYGNTTGENPDDALLADLSNGYNKIPKNKPPTTQKELTEEELGAYLIKKSSELIELSMDSVEDLKISVVQGQNPDEIAALASLITSTTGAIESLNKLNMLKRKHEMTKEIKALDWSNKKEVAKSLPAMNITNNTNVLVATREEILKKMLEIEEPEPIVPKLIEIESDLEENVEGHIEEGEILDK